MSTSAGKSFPFELIENIIIYVDHADTLRSFALTCRDLLPVTRRRLFRAVDFVSKERLDAFSDFLKTHEDLKSVVQSVRMVPVGSHEQKPQLLVNAMPFPLLSQLPGLREWKIHAWSHIVYFHPRTLSVLRLPRYAHIEELKLTGLKFISHTEFTRFIAAFAGLRRLNCYDLDVVKTLPHSDPPYIRPIRLTEIIVSIMFILSEQAHLVLADREERTSYPCGAADCRFDATRSSHQSNTEKARYVSG